MPKLSPFSTDAATAADRDTRSRLVLLAQAGQVYQCLDQSYGYFRHAEVDPEPVLLTLQGLVRPWLRRPRRTDHRQRSFLRPIHPDDKALPAHLLAAVPQEWIEVMKDAACAL